MDLIGALNDAAQMLRKGQVSEKRETVADCVPHLVMRLVDAYVLQDSGVGRELAHLREAIRNPKDPAVKAMDLPTKIAMRGLLLFLDQAKETHRRAQETPR